MLHNGSTKRSAGGGGQGNFSFPSAHEAKANCLVLFFLVQS